ncbi:HIT family protein [Peribacillus frigoritolerans]|uniref:HIT family protein n=1 Tax=Peribacillus frigoritolerans TaxID=450367 RepID=UPI00105A728E|nr:HIT family protein [Peribacillus frigoritolerans]TDL76130.1 HIT family protein [Peribacillus frigoritolerans]
MVPCLFCKIIEKKADAYIIYENDSVCCFLDKFPINKGHVLIVPKKHYQEFSEVDVESLNEIILIAQKVAISLETLLNTDGITIMQNNGIFKDVEHYHMHIIPRFKDDGFSWNEPKITVNQDDFIQLKASLQINLSKK